jgi:hypothetical protein
MDVYAPPLGTAAARQPNWWTRIEMDLPRCDVGSICTVKDIPGDEKAVLCYADGPLLIPHPSMFWEVLRKWQRDWMWDNLQLIGDDDWIATAIAEGTCIVVTDGSYMKDLYPHIHSAAVVLKCTKGRGRVWCSFLEASQVACSYCGELIGLMAIHLILLAINEVNPGLEGSVHIYSDCLGALEKVKNLPSSRIPSHLAHSDVLKNILVNCSKFSFD